MDLLNARWHAVLDEAGERFDGCETGVARTCRVAPRGLEVDEEGTVVSRSYTGKPSRVLRNDFTDRWKGHDAELMPMPWQRIRVESLVAPAKAAGRVDIANFPTGQGAGAIRDIPAAADLFRRLVAESESALCR